MSDILDAGRERDTHDTEITTIEVVGFVYPIGRGRRLYNYSNQLG
jgi:hypothetical protein